MAICQYLLGYLLSLLPYRVIVAAFHQAVGIQPDLRSTRFYFSGRVALYRMALACKQEDSTVLIPDYICNVVPKAFQEAGLTVSSYSTDERFEPSIQAIQQLVRGQSSALLCLAPIMGAEGGVSWIFSPEGKSWRAKNNITLFMDLSQCISRLKSLSTMALGERVVLMASFNNKAFPGVMGAVVISDMADPLFTAATEHEQRAITKYFVKRLIKPILSVIRKPSHASLSLQQGQTSHFEYSYCQQFPYTFAHSGASKLQVAIATLGLRFNRYYQWRKQTYLHKGFITPQPRPFYLSAPYILAESATQQLRKKVPYACQDKPNDSERPDTLAYHFKGFDDQ